MQIRLGGVPEQFNMPWHYAIQKKYFEKAGIQLIWFDYPSGTGAMCKDLNENKIDIAVVLTEGIICDIAKGASNVLLQWFVTSPLIWGVHTNYNSAINETSNLQNVRFAISRFGSGSHLMAYVYAKSKGHTISDEQFVLVHTMSGAESALAMKKADLFLWEKFTTKPLVDKKIFRRIDECPTPWPCFVLAARKDFVHTYTKELRTFLYITNHTLAEFAALHDKASMISSHYNLNEEDVHTWLSYTTWSDGSPLSMREITPVINTLYTLQLIKGSLPNEIIANLTQ